jgi:histidyl-tRNA synthetase
MKVQRCKGSRDLSPDEMISFRLIEGIFRECCLKSGYGEVRTPTLEYLHFFTSTGTLTPSMLSKVYSFLDWDGWSGERVVLKPDGTIPIARLFIESMAEKKLAKLFYVTNIFIFEETGKETRERWQCGAELIGVSSTMADVELIMLALEVLGKLKLNQITLKLSHAGLIRALVLGLDLRAEEQTRLFDQILDGNTEVLTRIKPQRPELREALSLLLNLRGKSSGFLKNSKAQFIHSLPEIESPLDDFIHITDLLDALGCNYLIDIASGRGFEYYTGVIFQIFVGDEKVGGGGRYDALIPLMGGRDDIPASGFALYLDPLMKLIKPEVLRKTQPQRILIRVGPQGIKEGIGIARRLRKAGYIAELNLGAQEIANFGWAIDVRGKAPSFVLTDQVNHRRFERQAADELLKLLLEVGGLP